MIQYVKCGRTLSGLNGVYLFGGSYLASPLPGGFLTDPVIGEISATGEMLIMGSVLSRGCG